MSLSTANSTQPFAKISKSKLPKHGPPFHCADELRLTKAFRSNTNQMFAIKSVLKYVSLLPKQRFIPARTAVTPEKGMI